MNDTAETQTDAPRGDERSTEEIAKDERGTANEEALARFMVIANGHLANLGCHDGNAKAAVEAIGRTLIDMRDG